MDEELLTEFKDTIRGFGEEVVGYKAKHQAIETRLDTIEKKMNRPRTGGELNPGEKSDTAPERKALGVLVKDGNEAELKAMSVGIDPAGGYLVIPHMAETMITRLYEESPVRRLARVETIESGDSWEEPIDKGEPDATWVGETQPPPSGASPPLGMLKVPLVEICAHQKVTQKLLDLSYLNLGAWIEVKITDKFARTEALAHVAGNSQLRPRGFLTYPTSADPDATRAVDTLQSVKSGAATTVTSDGLRDLYWALRSPHRKNATWLMSGDTANQIDKLKNGNGDYIWRTGMQSGSANELLNLPVEFCEDMPSVAVGTLPIALGDWKQGYLIVDHSGIKFIRDPLTEKPHVIFYSYKRTGGGVANTDAIKLLEIGV